MQHKDEHADHVSVDSAHVTCVRTGCMASSPFAVGVPSRGSRLPSPYFAPTCTTPQSQGVSFTIHRQGLQQQGVMKQPSVRSRHAFKAEQAAVQHQGPGNRAAPARAGWSPCCGVRTAPRQEQRSLPPGKGAAGGRPTSCWVAAPGTPACGGWACQFDKAPPKPGCCLSCKARR